MNDMTGSFTWGGMMDIVCFACLGWVAGLGLGWG